MRFLLDVNVLVAWGWSDQLDHRRVTSWIASLPSGGRILTFAIPNLDSSVSRRSGPVGWSR